MIVDPREHVHADSMKNVLFVCSQNRLRSPTAEQVFASHPMITVTSAGTNHDAENPVTPELLEWADIIFVMERIHRTKWIVCLDIPDEYEFMDEELVRLVKAKVSRHIPSE